jgi:hypothetical protein
MPAIPAIYNPDNQAINQLADDERTRRNGLIDAYWRYYEGRHRRWLRQRPGDPDFNITLNLCGQAINKLVDFVAPTAPTLTLRGGIQRTVAPDGSLVEQRSPEQQALDRFWDVSDLDVDFTDVLISGFVTGHTFLRLIIREDNNVEVRLLDPRHVTVFWNVANVRQRLWYRLYWMQATNEERRQDIVPTALLVASGRVPREQIENMSEEELNSFLASWSVLEYAKPSTGKWEVVASDMWPYPFPPIVDWKNAHRPHEYYGLSDLAHADLNDAINLVASNIAKIIFHHAGPQTVIVGGTLGQAGGERTVDTGPSTVLEFEDPDTKVYNLEMTSDLAASLNMMQVLRETFFSQMRVFDSSAHKDKLARVTNFGVRMLHNDMIGMMRSKRHLIGRGLAETARRALFIQGFEVERDQIQVNWDDPIPQNRVELVGALLQEQQIGGTSIQTLLEDLGRDPTVEHSRRKIEERVATDAVADVLARIGERGGPVLGTRQPGRVR